MFLVKNPLEYYTNIVERTVICVPRTAPNPTTLEEAREILLQYTDELNQLDQTVENLNSAAAENVRQIAELRTLNQQLYLRLPQMQQEDETTDETENRESLEDFARNKLKGMIR